MLYLSIIVYINIEYLTKKEINKSIELALHDYAMKYIRETTKLVIFESDEEMW